MINSNPCHYDDGTPINNFNPHKWGQSYWDVLYFTAFSYPLSPSLHEMLKTKNLILSLCDLLPCCKCRLNFSSHILSIPLTNIELKNRSSLISWVINLNNIVNHSLHKPPVSKNFIFSKYLSQQCLTDCSTNSPIFSSPFHISLSFILSIIFIFFLFFVYLKFFNH